MAHPPRALPKNGYEPFRLTCSVVMLATGIAQLAIDRMVRGATRERP